MQPLFERSVVGGTFDVSPDGRFLMLDDDRSDDGQARPRHLVVVHCVFTTFDIVEPDLLLVTTDQRHILSEKHLRGAPALVAEVLSPGTRRVDLRTKRDLYDRVGVREYWIVDPEADEICVYRQTSSGQFPRAARLSAQANDTLTTPLLPAFGLPLPEFFQREPLSSPA